MATFKYFHEYNGQSLELTAKYLCGIDKSEAKVLFPGIKAKSRDSFSYYTARDESGNYLPITRMIEYKSNPSKHKCDARCLNAKGFKCECECGGKNHGRGFVCD